MKENLKTEHKFFDHLWLFTVTAPILVDACWAIASSSLLWMVVYLGVAAAYVIVEMKFLCVHCPYYIQQYCRLERLVPCKFSLKPAKLVQPKPGPLSLIDKIFFYSFAVIVGAFPLYWMILEPKFLGFYFLAIVGFFTLTLKFSCHRCIFFHCPLNRVSKEVRDDYLRTQEE